MANCPAKAAYGFMDLDTRTAKWDSRVIYWAKNFVLLQVLQHPFENEGRPLPFNWGYWLNPGEESVVHPIFSCYVSQSQAQRFVTGALQLYPEHTENLLRSFWMRSWGEQKVWTIFKYMYHILGLSGWCDPCLLPKFNLKKKKKSLICPESTKKHFHFLYSSVQTVSPVVFIFSMKNIPYPV